MPPSSVYYVLWSSVLAVQVSEEGVGLDETPDVERALVLVKIQAGFCYTFGAVLCVGSET